ncbi:transposable element Tcb2 transposase [Trichonephila clavipes]|nr:transposable element Tcb2 transposase [Trichonephila clavipes]
MSTMSQRSHLSDSEAWRVVGSVNGSETPKYERYSSPTTLCSAIGTTVSTQTVRNRLHGVGLYARRPMVCVRLTSRHRRDRREWATEHVVTSSMVVNSHLSIHNRFCGFTSWLRTSTTSSIVPAFL